MTAISGILNRLPFMLLSISLTVATISVAIFANTQLKTYRETSIAGDIGDISLLAAGQADAYRILLWGMIIAGIFAFCAFLAKCFSNNTD